jgi:hypothetical protein
VFVVIGDIDRADSIDRQDTDRRRGKREREVV